MKHAEENVILFFFQIFKILFYFIFFSQLFLLIGG